MEEEKEYDLMVWDLETTGFVAPASKILEIGCFLIKGDQVEKKHWVFQNNCEIPENITQITGITKEIIDTEGKDPVENLNEFLPFFKKSKRNVTHNGVRFDIPFLLAFAADLLKWTPENLTAVKGLIESTAFDTAVHFKASKLRMIQLPDESFVKFAKRVMDVRAAGVKFNLTLCAQEIGIDLTGIIAHRALADVDVTYKIYEIVAGNKKQNELPF